jgi:hypothetical protein
MTSIQENFEENKQQQPATSSFCFTMMAKVVRLFRFTIEYTWKPSSIMCRGDKHDPAGTATSSSLVPAVPLSTTVNGATTRPRRSV